MCVCYEHVCVRVRVCCEYVLCVVCACVCMCMCICMCVCASVFLYASVCACMQVCVRVRVCKVRTPPKFVDASSYAVDTFNELSLIQAATC